MTRYDALSALYGSAGVDSPEAVYRPVGGHTAATHGRLRWRLTNYLQFTRNPLDASPGTAAAHMLATALQAFGVPAYVRRFDAYLPVSSGQTAGGWRKYGQQGYALLVIPEPEGVTLLGLLGVLEKDTLAARIPLGYFSSSIILENDRGNRRRLIPQADHLESITPLYDNYTGGYSTFYETMAADFMRLYYYMLLGSRRAFVLNTEIETLAEEAGHMAGLNRKPLGRLYDVARLSIMDYARYRGDIT